MSCRLALATLCAAVLASVACTGDDATIPTTAKGAADSADQIMFGVEHYLTTAGIQQANLTADTAYLFNEGSRIELRGVKVEFFSKTGTPTGTLTAREGTYRQRGGNMEARGDVVLVGEDGRRLTTEQLAYDQRANRISTDSAWVMTQANGDVGRGVGFVTDPQLTTFRCGNCSGVVTTPPSVDQPPPPP
jgi:LPS export ABC transporter protein LptC